MADITAPTLLQMSPLDNATGVSVTSNLRLGFSEAVNATSGLIKIYKSDGTLFHTIAANDTSQVSFDSTKARVTIDPSVTLLAGTGYYVIIEPGAFKDLAGNNYAGLSSPTAFNFSTAGTGGANPPADTTAPLLMATSPTNNAGNVPSDANLVLTFNEAVKAGTGEIQIRLSSTGSVVQGISVTDANKVTFTGNQVIVNPGPDLSPWVSYYVTIGSGVILDLANNPYAGMFNSAEFNFTTNSVYVDTTAPLVLFTTPSSNITGSTNIVITYNEPVMAGTGSIEIHRTSDGSLYRTISVNDGAQVAFSGRNVTINPSTDLDPANTYYIVLAPGVITDLHGNDYDGSSSVAAFVASAGAVATAIGTSAYGVSAVAQPSATSGAFIENGGIVVVGGAGYSAFASAHAVASVTGVWQTVASVTATATGGWTSSLGDFIAGNDTPLDLAALNYSAMMNGEIILVSNTRVDIVGSDGLTYRVFGSDFSYAFTTVAELGGANIWLVEVWQGSGADERILRSHYNQFGNVLSMGSFDVTTGLGGHDSIVGSSDDDSLFGFGGNDVIIGREGDDVLDGGLGDDVLSGGSGSDSIAGGAGADIYKFVSLAHLNGDAVNGLELTDKIDLGEIGALSFIGANPFSNAAGQVRYTWSAGNTTLQIDSDGNGVSDTSLLLKGAQFILAETAPGSSVFVMTGIAPPAGLVLTGTSAANTLVGGTGNDTITGLGRGDTLTGGGGADKFVYTLVSDSTGRGFDTITDFNASADLIDVWFQVTGVDTAVTSGSLSPFTIDANLASAVGDSKLGSHHAVLFTPNAGLLSGKTFLIVDANGVAGYQASADLVILLGNASSLGGLTAADFV